MVGKGCETIKFSSNKNQIFLFNNTERIQIFTFYVYVIIGIFFFCRLFIFVFQSGNVQSTDSKMWRKTYERFGRRFGEP